MPVINPVMATAAAIVTLVRRIYPDPLVAVTNIGILAAVAADPVRVGIS